MGDRDLKNILMRESINRPRGIGIYKAFSMIMNLIEDEERARSFLLSEGYEKTEITRARSKYFKTKAKAPNPVSAF